MDALELAEIQAMVDRLKENIGKVIVGKDDLVESLLIAVIARGHVLLEDVPGTGKTLLAKALARSMESTAKRVQFTPDLLPSDLTGINFFNQKTGEFEFRPGPVFTGVMLADEINRATPRTQSSLLECMEERQVSLDGVTYELEQPFLVIATQNPVESHGTFPLPEAQLDRFLVKLHMGYPSTDEGMAILRRFQSSDPLSDLQPVVTRGDILGAQRGCTAVEVSDDVMRYLLQVVEQTRQHPDVVLGVSPRGSQALLRAVQVRAAFRGREFVTPDDVKAMSEKVLSHRMVTQYGVRKETGGATSIVRHILSQIPVPTESFETVKR